MPREGAHDARVSDDDGVVFERGGKLAGARVQRGDGFTAGRREAENVGGPGIDFPAVDVVPAPSFPRAEIDLGKPRIDAHGRVRRQLPRQTKRAPQRAGMNGKTRRQAGAQSIGNETRIAAIHVEASVTDAGIDERRRMADQENLHSRPP